MYRMFQLRQYQHRQLIDWCKFCASRHFWGFSLQRAIVVNVCNGVAAKLCRVSNGTLIFSNAPRFCLRNDDQYVRVWKWRGRRVGTLLFLSHTQLFNFSFFLEGGISCNRRPSPVHITGYKRYVTVLMICYILTFFYISRASQTSFF